MRMIWVVYVFRYGNKVDIHGDSGKVWYELWQRRLGYEYDKDRVCV